jgi:circadian clock protein KaiB
MTSSIAARPADASAPLRLCLYVAGSSPNSVAAIHNLRAALSHLPEHAIDLEVIDILVDPARAAHDGVLLTPMLVKLEPPPERRVLGNLSNREELLRALGLDEVPGA